MTYFPDRKSDWLKITPDEGGLNAEKLDSALKFVESHETSWPHDIHQDGAQPTARPY